MRAFQCGLASLWGVSPIHLGQSVTRFIKFRAIFYLSIAYLICYKGGWISDHCFGDVCSLGFSGTTVYNS